MILVSPLDWGLGHATRCVPIISKCLADGSQVLVATSGNALSFLRQEFPNVKCINLKGYRMRYAGGRLLPFVIMMQMPLFCLGIWLEHIRLRRIIKDYGVSRVISDNRYGLWNKSVESIIITHQLYIQLPKWLSPFSKPLHSFTAHLLHRFNKIWVPDYADAKVSLSGALSHGGKLDSEVSYIGPLSRFSTTVGPVDIDVPDVLLLLSGPGRQKHTFAKQVLNGLQNTQKRILVVSAEPKLKYEITNGNILTVNHLSTEKLNYLLLFTPQIIARAGYSTIMDLHILGKEATLVPTQGQWEQEYLAKRCATPRHIEPNA